MGGIVVGVVRNPPIRGGLHRDVPVRLDRESPIAGPRERMHPDRRGGRRRCCRSRPSLPARSARAPSYERPRPLDGATRASAERTRDRHVGSPGARERSTTMRGRSCRGRRESHSCRHNESRPDAREPHPRRFRAPTAPRGTKDAGPSRPTRRTRARIGRGLWRAPRPRAPRGRRVSAPDRRRSPLRDGRTPARRTARLHEGHRRTPRSSGAAWAPGMRPRAGSRTGGRGVCGGARTPGRRNPPPRPLGRRRCRTPEATVQCCAR